MSLYTKIRNIEELRDHALATIDKLAAGKIDVTDAVAASKLYSNVMDSVKLELDYHKILDRKETIHFMEPQDKPEKAALSQDQILQLENKFK